MCHGSVGGGTYRGGSRRHAKGSMLQAEKLLQISRIYVEPAAAALPRGQEILARWPEADVVEVASHWRIPELSGDEANVRRWVRIKTEALDRKSVV